jgi:hypothetical protein
MARIASHNEAYQSFGKLCPSLVFPNPLPLSEALPEELPEGRPLWADHHLHLCRHSWADGRSSFSLDGQLLPVALYQRERVTISRTKETKSTEGYAWALKVPPLDNLLRLHPPEFVSQADGTLVARIFHDVVVHSTGLTTYLYLILDPNRGSLELQYYHEFDGE